MVVAKFFILLQECLMVHVVMVEGSLVMMEDSLSLLVTVFTKIVVLHCHHHRQHVARAISFGLMVKRFLVLQHPLFHLDKAVEKSPSVVTMETLMEIRQHFYGTVVDRKRLNAG